MVERITATRTGTALDAKAASFSRRLESALSPEPEPQPSSRNSVRFRRAAPPVRSSNPHARVSARSPAAFAGDYNGRQSPQSAHRGPSRDLLLPLGNCFSFWPPFEPGVFLTIFPLFECSIDDCQLVFIDRQSAIGDRKFSSTSSCGGTAILAATPHGRDARAPSNRS